MGAIYIPDDHHQVQHHFRLRKHDYIDVVRSAILGQPPVYYVSSA